MSFTNLTNDEVLGGRTTGGGTGRRGGRKTKATARKKPTGGRVKKAVRKVVRAVKRGAKKATRMVYRAGRNPLAGGRAIYKSPGWKEIRPSRTKKMRPGPA